jgi:hypothetical protein
VISLPTFLLDRYARDEQDLRRILAGAKQTRAMIAEQQLQLLGRLVPGWALWPDVETAALAGLAQLDARRRTVKLLQAIEPETACYGYEEGHAAGKHELAQDVLFLLALPYAPHPDYREEWKP